MQLLLQEKTVQKDQLPLLLSLGPDSGLLISPKNITKYLFNRKRMSSKQEESSNCYIEAHFGHKLFICGSRSVGEGEELVVDQQSL